MLSAWGYVVCRLRWSVLGAGLAIFVLAAGWGSGVFGDLAGAGFSDPGSESAQADQVEDRDLLREEPDVVLLYRSNDLTADDPEYRGSVEDDLAQLAPSDVLDVQTPWSTGSPRLVSTDGHSIAVPLRLVGADESARKDVFERIRDELSSPPTGFDIEVGGDLAIDYDIKSQVRSDIQKAELLSLPILLALLILLLGGVVAATVPLVIGAVVIVGAFALLRGLTQATDVSVFSVNVVIMLGLGLAVDYALLMITRFRQELRRQDTVAAAIAQTLATTGRTVLVSGVIVATTLATLLLFPQVYFRSIGLAGIAITALAVLAALTILPAVLAVLGPRIDALAVLPGWVRGSRELPGSWFRFAKAVMRRPIAVLLVMVPLLLLLGLPFLRVQFGQIDYRALPQETESRQVAEQLTADFPGGEPDPINVLVTFLSGAPSPAATVALGEYIERLRGLPGVTSAMVTAEAGATARVSVRHPYGEEEPAQSRRLVADIRATTPPTGGQALVGGSVAELVDLIDNLRKILPFMVATMFAMTLLVLFLAFGSVALPLAAVVLSVLSMSASFGAIVWVFQDGHLSGLLGFTPTGTVEATQPILMFAIAFGLSTDYAVFLISRVREEWDRTHDNTLAVATGMEHTAPIITSAALLLVVVVGAFSLSGISFVKMIGLGLVFTILIDATVIRAILLPATMGLLGPASWWLPSALAGFVRRFGIRDAPAFGQLRGPVPTPLPEDALPAVRELARLHATTWDDPALARLAWLNHLDPVTAGTWQKLYHDAWRSLTSRPETVLEPELFAIGTALDRSDFAGWVCANHGHRALLHADLHLDLPFTTGVESRREAVPVNGQLVMHAPPLIDVAYLVGRLPTEVRRATEWDLVGAYHAHLVEGGITGYPLEQCWRDYKRWIWFGVFSVVVSAARIMSDDELRSHINTVIRYLTQALDHEAVRFLTRTSVRGEISR
ncbi:MAG: MMPL family transporter [Pseudonocardiaceae bacterium]